MPRRTRKSYLEKRRPREHASDRFSLGKVEIQALKQLEEGGASTEEAVEAEEAEEYLRPLRDVEELPYFFDLVFLGGSSIEENKPLVICLDDPQNRFIGALETLCKRIYREKRGGKPVALKITDLEELLKEERWIEAKDKIFSVQLSDEDWEKLFSEKRKDWERIWNRIQQLYSQTFGMLIFNRRTIPAARVPEHAIDKIEMKPIGLNYKEELEIAKLSWGISNFDPGGSFSPTFNQASSMSENLLRVKVKEERGVFRDATNEHKGRESDLHLRMKQFIVKILVNEFRDQGFELEIPEQIFDKIETEKEINENVTADVFNKVKSEVYEIETLFSEDREGSEPRNKLRESFLKYDGTQVKKINIVLDPITFLRHLGDIAQLREVWPAWKDKVNFLTLNFEEERFVSMNEVVKKIRDMIKKKFLKGKTPEEEALARLAVLT